MRGRLRESVRRIQGCQKWFCPMYRLAEKKSQGGMGYWNRIRKDFPEVFESRAKLERKVGHSMLKDKNGPVYLDELDSDRGDMNTEIFPECGIMCYLAQK